MPSSCKDSSPTIEGKELVVFDDRSPSPESMTSYTVERSSEIPKSSEPHVEIKQDIKVTAHERSHKNHGLARSRTSVSASRQQRVFPTSGEPVSTQSHRGDKLLPGTLNQSYQCPQAQSDRYFQAPGYQYHHAPNYQRYQYPQTRSYQYPKNDESKYLPAQFYQNPPAPTLQPSPVTATPTNSFPKPPQPDLRQEKAQRDKLEQEKAEMRKELEEYKKRDREKSVEEAMGRMHQRQKEVDDLVFWETQRKKDPSEDPAKYPGRYEKWMEDWIKDLGENKY